MLELSYEFSTLEAFCHFVPSSNLLLIEFFQSSVEETSHATEEKKAVIKDAEKEAKKVSEAVASVKPETKKNLTEELPSPESTTVAAAAEPEKQGGNSIG